MKIVGLNHGELNSSAALWIDGEFVAAAAEERFSRQKRTKVFPRAALEYCLDYAGVSLKDCDFIAQSWNPGAGWHKLQNVLTDVRTRREGYFYSLPEHLMAFAGTQAATGDWVKMDFAGETLPPLIFVQHHRAHAANAFFLSEFDEAAVVTADFRGEFETASISHGRGTELETIRSQKMPNSLGMFYATFTELLGYRPDSDEWKVMALSAIDVDADELYRRLRSTIVLLDNGFFEMDQAYYKGAVVDQPYLYTSKLVDLVGGRIGRAGEEPDEWHAVVAKAMQRLSEDIAAHMVTTAARLTKSRNLVLSGGYFMNCVFNGKALEQSEFENIFVSHSPADVGNCFGAASYVAHCLNRQPRKIGFNTSYLGPSFTAAQIQASLQRRQIGYQVVDSWQHKIAELLERGEIVAVMQGRMEFGERALGNRSILGDPRDADTKAKINSSIKFREGYRPFAPAALFESSHKFFEVDRGYACPYMEKVVKVRHAYRDRLPAITHFDGSARLQTVRKEDNPNFHAIISAFEKATGLPVVVNTSFNINGEPVVLSPDDALNTFFNSGLRHLFMENHYVQKA